MLRYAAPPIARRISIYASQFGSGDALHLNIFEQPVEQVIFDNLLKSKFANKLAEVHGNRTHLERL
jgi:hypothetical protein